MNAIQALSQLSYSPELAGSDPREAAPGAVLIADPVLARQSAARLLLEEAQCWFLGSGPPRTRTGTAAKPTDFESVSSTSFDRGPRSKYLEPFSGTSLVEGEDPCGRRGGHSLRLRIRTGETWRLRACWGEVGVNAVSDGDTAMPEKPRDLRHRCAKADQLAGEGVAERFTPAASEMASKARR